jgi:DNA-binding NtrC family response regulator
MTERVLLLVDDEPAVRLPLNRYLGRNGFDVREAASIAEAEEMFRSLRPDLALIDYSLPDGDGLELLARLHAIEAAVPVVMLTAHGSIDLAVKAIQQGADQFLTKPVELEALLVVLQRALENRRARQVSEATQSRRSRDAVDPFVGESRAIRRLAEQAAKIASAASPVLIQGDTGSGKGVLARWLHENGPRRDEPFVDLNCAGLSRELMESELFGHQRGAFTGAVAPKRGLMEVAHRGMLFLDEIGDVDLLVQAKLLKVIEEKRFRRLGETDERRVDVRFVAATHHDLEQSVHDRRFREDLYFRLRGIPLRVPPLRERGDDVILLARQLLDRLAAELPRPRVTLSPGAERALLEHKWPGNIRELRNVLEHAVLLSPRAVLEADDLAEGLRGPHSATPTRRSRRLEDVEREHIETVVREEGGSVTRAAEVLGLSRSALYERIRKSGIPVPSRRP